ncbi:hypothetical protein [Salmon gill poxvirus]
MDSLTITVGNLQYVLTGTAVVNRVENKGRCQIEGVVGNHFIPSQNIRLDTPQYESRKHFNESNGKKPAWEQQNSGMQKLGKFGRIRERLSHQDWENAYNEIMGLSYIKLPLMKELYFYKAHSLMTSLSKEPNFKNMVELLPTIIRENVDIDITLFGVFDDSISNNIIQAILDVENGHVLIPQFLTVVSPNWMAGSFKKNLKLCMSTPKIKHMVELCKGVDQNYLTDIITEMTNVNINIFMHVVHSIMTTMITSPKNKDKILNCVLGKLTDKNVALVNIDSWAVYCDMTSTLIDTHSDFIKNLMKQSLNAPVVKTVIFTGSRSTVYSNPKIDFFKISSSLVTKKDFLSMLLEGNDETQLYDTNQEFSFV